MLFVIDTSNGSAVSSPDAIALAFIVAAVATIGDIVLQRCQFSQIVETNLLCGFRYCSSHIQTAIKRNKIRIMKTITTNALRKLRSQAIHRIFRNPFPERPKNNYHFCLALDENLGHIQQCSSFFFSLLWGNFLE